MLNFLLETFLLGLKNLRLHKLRSLLTALGIIFGVAAVIIMVAIGEGTKQAALEQIQQLGATNILVRSVQPPESNEASQPHAAHAGVRAEAHGPRAARDAARASRRSSRCATPSRRSIRGDVRAPTPTRSAPTPDVFDVINLAPARGEFFTQLQYDRGDAVCVLGATGGAATVPLPGPARPDDPGRHAAGSASIVLTVIGVLEPTGLRAGTEGAAIMQRDLDLDIYFPLTLAQSVFGDSIIRSRPARSSASRSS